jgi:hypothetical protein
LPPSFYATSASSSGRYSPSKQLQHRSTEDLLATCAGCQELRGQVNFLSQKLHHARAAKAEEVQRAAVTAAGQLPWPGGVGLADSSLRQNDRRGVGGVQSYSPLPLASQSSHSVLSPAAASAIGRMRDGSTMSTMSAHDISRLEAERILDML